MYILLFISLVSSLSPLYTWIPEVNMQGLIPSPRGGHSSSALGRVIYIFGGCDNSMQCYNDLHTYNTDSHLWSRINATGDPPSPRGGHSGVFLGTRLLIFGGSSRGMEFNDFYEYDALSNHWKNVLAEGEKPLARSNHAADIDYEGNLIIFGGFNSRGYLNDIWAYNPPYNKWVRFETSGNAPSPRELSSLSIQGKIGYVFGGFHVGGVSGELYMIDLELMKWSRVIDDGYFPEPRQGHSAVRLAEFLFILGGCNFGLKTCFDDLYVLDLLTLWWTKLEHRPFSPLPPQKERIGTVAIASNIYLFGGCYLNKHCFNDLTFINTGIQCNCLNNGVCRAGVCICNKGYSGHDCSVRATCKENCLLRGFCTSSGKCDCYPGYKGEICEYQSFCPNNCTAVNNGICQPDGLCQCNFGYSGKSCECQCQNGFCYENGCVCKIGWIGNKCDIKDSTYETKTTENLAGNSQNISKSIKNEENITAVVPKNAGKTNEVVTENSSEEGPNQSEVVPLAIVPLNDHSSEVSSDSADASERSLECESKCDHGKCIEKKCYCASGYTGEFCDKRASGIRVIYVSGIALTSLIIGVILGCIYYSSKKSRADPEEFPLIHN